MIRTLILFLIITTLSISASADERIEHFEGEPSETLEEAVKNFSEYNKKLASILEKDELTNQDIVKVHQLTYTLENALSKINDEMEELAETLEEIHLASEKVDTEKVKNKGTSYLNTAQTVIP